MRADYATSDLINKVNSDWINEVLINPELDRGDDDDATDLMLRPQSSRKQTIPRWREPARRPGRSAKVDYPEPGIMVQPMSRPSRRRSVARRVTERLALAVAALGLAWAGVSMAPGPRDVTNSVPMRATSGSPESVAPIDTTEPNSVGPAWLVPEILYGPARAPSPMRPAQAARPVPTPGR
jgi:hypothetical protein